MTFDLLLALITFAFVSSITPGPNNLMLMASGANYGIRRTLPHMIGISLGHAFMVTLVGVFLLRVFESYPVINIILKTLSVAYMLWLAWKIATALPPESKEVTGNPLTFLQAAAFQWVNPKAWYMAITAITVYVPPDQSALIGSLMVAGVFSMTNFPSVSVWAWLGVQMRRVLGSPRRLRQFNITMALLLIASLYPVLVG